MANKKLAEHKLQLAEVVEGLIADGLLDAERGRTLMAVVAASRQSEHPLITIAHHKWPDARNPQRLLDLETLCEWQAGKAGMPYVRIDPLKIDIPAITGVMSYAYARRFNILALELSLSEITIATAEPYVEEWARELARLTGRSIKRVMADPEKIANYLVEFYTLSRSVRSAVDDSRQSGRSGMQNLEQLMELGKAGKLDADDQHIINIVDWLLQYAYSQRASDIHIEPRREQTNVRFRIDGVMQLVYQIPPAVGAAVTTRIKILGRMDIAEKRRPQDGRLKTRNA
ncbi:MAG TPA: ATPase, T2SS/T4P/T4SS family, partial [Gammaproteobacteria bacterium]